MVTQDSQRLTKKEETKSQEKGEKKTGGRGTRTQEGRNETRRQNSISGKNAGAGKIATAFHN